MTQPKKIHWLDEEIEHLEKLLALRNEQRREIINRGNLNKCQHENTVSVSGLLSLGGCTVCTDCKKAIGSCASDDTGKKEEPLQHETKPEDAVDLSAGQPAKRGE